MRQSAIALTDDDIALALRDPLAAHMRCQRRASTSDLALDRGGRPPFRVSRPSAPVRLPTSRELWEGENETIVLQAAEDLVALLESFALGPWSSTSLSSRRRRCGRTSS